MGFGGRVVRNTAINNPEPSSIIQDDVLYVDEACAWILPGRTVLYACVGPWLFIVERSANHNVVGCLSAVAGICQVELVSRVDG